MLNNGLLQIQVTCEELKAIEAAANETGAAAELIMAVERAAAALNYVKCVDDKRAAEQVWAAHVSETGEKRGEAWDVLLNVSRRCEAARVEYVHSVEGGMIA